MTFKNEWIWLILGAFLLAISGIVTTNNRFYYFTTFGFGWVIVIYTLRKGGLMQPRTAITLLFVSNLAFWCSYGLWKLHAQIRGSIQMEGIDPFGIAVSIWLIVFVIIVLYEVIVFSRGLFDRFQRRLSTIGLICFALQFPITVRIIYTMLRGI